MGLKANLEKACVENLGSDAVDEGNCANQAQMMADAVVDWITSQTFRIVETCKNVSTLSLDLVTSDLKRYSSHIKESVEGAYKICFNTLKPMGIDLPNTTKLKSYLNSDLHPSMAQMYNDKVLKIDDLIGLKPHIKGH